MLDVRKKLGATGYTRTCGFVPSQTKVTLRHCTLPVACSNDIFMTLMLVHKSRSFNRTFAGLFISFEASFAHISEIKVAGGAQPAWQIWRETD
jgi:hypothetical protein